MSKRLVRNKVKCNSCDEIIESKYTHDFRTCSCGNTCVDGGLDYNRVLFMESGFTDLCEYELSQDMEN